MKVYFNAKKNRDPRRFFHKRPRTTTPQARTRIPCSPSSSVFLPSRRYHPSCPRRRPLLITACPHEFPSAVIARAWGVTRARRRSVDTAAQRAAQARLQRATLDLWCADRDGIAVLRAAYTLASRDIAMGRRLGSLLSMRRGGRRPAFLRIFSIRQLLPLPSRRFTGRTRERAPRVWSRRPLANLLSVFD